MAGWRQRTQGGEPLGCGPSPVIKLGGQLVGHVSTSVTETVYRHEIRPVLTKGAAAMDKIFEKAPETA